MRRTLQRRGYYLKKSRRKDPQALDYKKYWIVELQHNVNIAGDQWGMDLEDVVAWVDGE